MYVEDLNALGMETARSNIPKELSRASAVKENPGRLQESFSLVTKHSFVHHLETNHDLP